MTPPLRPLEFTGADIFKAYRASEDLVIPGETDSNDALAIVLNRLLAERLEKAPEITYWKTVDNFYVCPIVDPENKITHRARLVCIEKLEGK